MKTVDINYTKYTNKRDYIQTTDESGKVIQRDEKEIECRNKEKEVCLKCTRKKCKGGEKCFEARRKEQENDKG